MTAANAARGRILLVEDDDSLRTDMCEGLTYEGHVVTAVASAEEALVHLQAQSCDLLIADYRLAGATGAWLAQVAVQSGRLSTPQVLLMTGHHEVPEIGGFEVMRKPFDYAALLAKVAQVLGSRTESSPPPIHPNQRIALTLYVNDAPASKSALQNLRVLIRSYCADQIALTIIDITKEVDHRVEEDRIVVTPTLVKTFPPPRTWIIGDLGRSDRVERILSQAGVERIIGTVDDG